MEKRDEHGKLKAASVPISFAMKLGSLAPSDVLPAWDTSLELKRLAQKDQEES